MCVMSNYIAQCTFKYQWGFNAVNFVKLWYYLPEKMVATTYMQTVNCMKSNFLYIESQYCCCQQTSDYHVIYRKHLYNKNTFNSISYKMKMTLTK